ncbi:MAG: hypothetical protein J6O51_02290 [Bacteroidales bacterium]|nr:hypothetical protein [Bacteroidales bacterium]
MKISFHFLATLSVFAAVSCVNELDPVSDGEGNDGPVILSATVEDNTKAIVKEDSGAFEFSAEDQILVWNGIKGYYGTTSQGGAKADFTMEKGFDPELKGFAAFPHNRASFPNESRVDFSFPQTYKFLEVGSISDNAIREGLSINFPVGPDHGKVPCPMIAYYNGDGKLNFRHVGALVRFRITNTSADTATKALEDLVFTFTTPVTGDFSMSRVPTGPNEGVHASDITKYVGYSITVTEVPKTTAGQYVYITLPVPVDTDPNNVGIFQVASRRIIKTLHGTPVSLKRADGYKVGTSLELDPLSSFGGRQIAGYLHYGKNAHHGEEIDYEIYPYHYWPELSVHSERNVTHFDYNNIIGTDNDYNGMVCDHHIELCGEGVEVRYGDYGKIKVRIPKGLGSDWFDILGAANVENKRPGATVYGTGGAHKGVHYAYVTVRNYNGDGNHCYGLLLFPDNAIITTKLSGYNIQITEFDKLCAPSTTGSDGNYVSKKEMNRLTDQGCFFMPAGFADTWDADNYDESDDHMIANGDGYVFKGILKEGRYWTATNSKYTPGTEYDLVPHYYYMKFSDTELPHDAAFVRKSTGVYFNAVVLIKAD